MSEDSCEVLGGGEAIVRVLGEEAEDGAFNVLGEIGAVGAGRNHRCVQVLGEDGERVVAVKRQTAGGELIQHDAEGVEIGAAVDFFAQRLLGRHVGDGAGDASLAGDADGAFADSEAEVDELDREGAGVISEENIGGFEVAVDEAVLVGVGQGIAELGGDLDGLFEGLGFAFLEARAFDQLHDEVGHVAVFADVVDGDNVRVAEGGRGAGLAEEALAGVADLEVGAEDLDRNRALEVRIPGAEDDAHAAAADLLVEAVAVGEDVADCGRRHHVDVCRRAVETNGFGVADVHNFVRIVARSVFRVTVRL